MSEPDLAVQELHSYPPPDAIPAAKRTFAEEMTLLVRSRQLMDKMLMLYRRADRLFPQAQALHRQLSPILWTALHPDTPLPLDPNNLRPATNHEQMRSTVIGDIAAAHPEIQNQFPNFRVLFYPNLKTALDAIEVGLDAPAQNNEMRLHHIHMNDPDDLAKFNEIISRRVEGPVHFFAYQQTLVNHPNYTQTLHNQFGKNFALTLTSAPGRPIYSNFIPYEENSIGISIIDQRSVFARNTKIVPVLISDKIATRMTPGNFSAFQFPTPDTGGGGGGDKGGTDEARSGLASLISQNSLQDPWQPYIL